MDKSLDPKEYNPEEVKKIIQIALLCTQSAVASRPTMSEVVVLLLTKNSSEFQPTRPTFIDAISRVLSKRGVNSVVLGSQARGFTACMLMLILEVLKLLLEVF